MTNETNLGLADMNQLIKKLAELRSVKREIEQKLSDTNKELDELNKSLIDILMANELTSFKSASGAISITQHFSASLPQGENKLIFFDHLKKIGEFDKLASIHSATFNSWVKNEYEQAQTKGIMEPSIPGVIDVKTLFRISFRS